MKKHLLIAALFITLVSNGQNDQIVIETKPSGYQSSLLERTFQQYKVIALDNEFVANAGAKLLELHLPDQKLSFQKKVNRILRKPFISVNNLPVAFNQELTCFNNESNASSHCRFTIGSGYIAGVYRFNGNTYYIEPAYRYDNAAPGDLLIIYKPEDILRSGSLVCGSAAGNDLPDVHNEKKANFTSNDCRTIDYTVLVDNSCFEYHHRSVDETVTQILTVMNLTEGDYTGNFNEDFRFEPYEIIIVDDPGHRIFEEYATINEQHASFVNQTTVTYKPGYDVVYNWYYNGAWDGIVGLANISSMCRPQNAKSTIADGGTLDGMRNLVSHETGHIFGCGHTNGCIMNDFINYSHCWVPSSVNTINDFLAGNFDGCLSGCIDNTCRDSLPDVKSVIYDSIQNEITVTTNIKPGETYLVKWGPDKKAAAKDSLLMVWPNETATFKPYCTDTSEAQSVEIELLCNTNSNGVLRYPIIVNQIDPVIKASRGKVCVGYDKDTLTVLNLISGYALRWLRNDEVISYANDSIFLADSPGVYRAEMATDKYDKCWMSSNPVYVWSIPPTKLNLTMSYSTKNYLTVDFRNYVFGLEEYDLDFGDGSPVEKDLDPRFIVTHVYPEAGKYMPIVYGIGCSIVHPDTSILYLSIDEFAKNSPVYAPSQHTTLGRFDCRYSTSFSKDSATAIHYISDEHFDRQRLSAEWVLKIDSGYHDNKVYPETFWLAGNADSLHFQNDLEIRIENDAKRIIFTITDTNNIQQEFVGTFPSIIDFHKWNSLAIRWFSNGPGDSYITCNINNYYYQTLYLPKNINNYADTLKLVNGKKPTLTIGQHYAGVNLQIAGFYGVLDAVRVTNLYNQLIDIARDAMNYKPLLSIDKENLICSDSIITISVTDVFTPVSREWYRNDTLIPNETDNNYLASESGSYYHIAKDTDETTCTTDPIMLKAVVVLSRWEYTKQGFQVVFKANPLCHSAIKWDFGDGTYSTELNPVKTYTSAGIYSVSLIASNNLNNAADTLTQLIIVTEEIEDDFMNQNTLGTPVNVSYDETYCNGQVMLRKTPEADPPISYIKYDSSFVPEKGTLEFVVNVKIGYSQYGIFYNKVRLLHLKSKGENGSELLLMVDYSYGLKLQYITSDNVKKWCSLSYDFRFNEWNTIGLSYGYGDSVILKVNGVYTKRSNFPVILNQPVAWLGGETSYAYDSDDQNEYSMFEGDVEKIRTSHYESDFRYSTACLLPVQIQSFRASDGCPPTIYWQVTNEQDIKGYYIEQSMDGKNFISVGYVPARAGSTSAYTYRFQPAVSKGFYYFRLRIEGKDGSTRYTETITARSICKGVVSVAPNPAGEMITIQGLTSLLNDFAIMNAAGVVIKKYKATSAKQINIAGLQSGVYVLQVNQNETVKFVKLP